MNNGWYPYPFFQYTMDYIWGKSGVWIVSFGWVNLKENRQHVLKMILILCWFLLQQILLHLKISQKCWFCALRQTSMHYPAKFQFFRNLSHCAIQTLIYCLCNGCISDIFKYKVLSIQKPIVVDVNCQYITFVYRSTFILSI